MRVDTLWYITRPTDKSELADILFAATHDSLERMFRGGLEARAIYGAYTDHDEAKAIAVTLLGARPLAPTGAGDTITPRDLADMIKGLLLTREGETLTQAVASERANNIAAALAGLRVMP